MEPEKRNFPHRLPILRSEDRASRSGRRRRTFSSDTDTSVEYLLSEWIFSSFFSIQSLFLSYFGGLRGSGTPFRYQRTVNAQTATSHRGYRFVFPVTSSIEIVFYRPIDPTVGDLKTLGAYFATYTI